MLLIFIVSGNSMWPTLHQGDWVVVSSGSCTAGALVVAAEPGGRKVVHRVVVGPEPSGSMWVSRGDNMPYCDAPWRPDQVVGVVTRVVRPEGDFAPENRITLKLRLRWTYLTTRWYAGRAYRKLVRRFGFHRSLPSPHGGVPAGEAAPATLAEAVAQATGPGLRGQTATTGSEVVPGRSASTF